MSTTEAELFLRAQPRLANGKVDINRLIIESKRRGYCVCPRALRQIINFDGLRCQWCMELESRRSWEFWYLEIPVPRRNWRYPA